MPNTVPPVTTVDMVNEYHETLKSHGTGTPFFMTLYLNDGLTPADVKAAKAAGIVGFKSYPKGLTTNSEAGVEGYEPFYPIFEAKQEEDLVLELHGEVPSSDADNVCVLNAERRFMVFLKVPPAHETRSCPISCTPVP